MGQDSIAGVLRVKRMACRMRGHQPLTQGQQGAPPTSKLSEEVARLGAQVKELEEKCQQPASELLQVRDTPPAHGIGEGAHRKGTPCWGLEDAGERQEREAEMMCNERD